VTVREFNVLDLTGLTESSDAQSAAQEADGDQLAIAVDVTTFTGTTPILDLTVQWSGDGTNWGDPEAGADTFTQITATGVVVKRFAVQAAKFRIDYAIGTTGISLAFRVDVLEIS
jgi:hypothetical protein